MKQDIAKKKASAQIGNEDESGFLKKRQGPVEMALMAAWGSSVAADDEYEDTERKRELAIKEENGHPIWANTKYWKQCIKMKIDEAKKRQMIKASKKSQDEIQYIDTMSGEQKK
jgi:hypothetical protein